MILVSVSVNSFSGFYSRCCISLDVVNVQVHRYPGVISPREQQTSTTSLNFEGPDFTKSDV